MNSKEFKQYLESLNACHEAVKWADGKTWEEVYNTCHRGDWLLWLYARSAGKDIRKLTLAKGHCANTVRRLMKDERSIAAVDAAIKFGEGNLTEKELASASAASAAAYAAAYAASDASDAAYAAYAAYADYAAYAAASAASDAAYAAYAASDASDASDAKKKNQQLTADICRKYLPFEIWNF